jgi:citrate lyase beta subunit
MVEQLSGYDVGALMYCPAYSHRTIADALLHEQYPKPFSLAFCLEDTVPEAMVKNAEAELFQILQQISLYRAEHEFYLPLIFVRVRSPQQLRTLATVYSPFSHILRGFILPKFFIENAPDYIQAIQEISAVYPGYYYMPIFESPSMIDLCTRYQNLAQVRQQLEAVSDKILNIRVGGNDLCHAFGLRRAVHDTIYDIKPVSNLLVDIVTTFAPQYVVSGPVWEYFAGEGWEDGLRKELSLDFLSGFIGKTVIHPNQIPVVNEMLKVSSRDYEDARSILGWDKNGELLVCSSTDATRMNEYNTHFNWANKILHLARAYGIRDTCG